MQVLIFKIVLSAFILLSNSSMAKIPKFGNFQLTENAAKSRINIAPVLEQIQNRFNGQFQQIAADQIEPLLNYNQNFDLGNFNFQGLNWLETFSTFGLAINRTLTADPERPDHWLVQDLLRINIDAKALLTELKKLNIIDIESTIIDAYAGVSYRKQFIVTHHARTYMEGLTKKLDYLFAAFHLFNFDQVQKLPNQTNIVQTDSLNFTAGASATISYGSSISLEAGGWIGHSSLSSVAIHKSDGLKIMSSKTSLTQVGGSLSLQLDLINLIRFTLLTGEISYQWSKSTEYSLNLSPQDLKNIQKSPDQFAELQSFIKGNRYQPDNLSSYAYQTIDTTEQGFNKQFQIFNFSKIRNKSTEQFLIQKDGLEKYFYKHHSQYQKVIKNFMGQVVDLATYNTLEMNFNPKVRAEIRKKLTLEYEAPEYHLDEPWLTDDPQKLSLRFEYLLNLNKTRGIFTKNNYTRAVRSLAGFSNIDDKIINQVRHKILKGPMSLKSELVILSEGIDYFLNQDQDLLFKSFINICSVKKHHQKWIDPIKRVQSLRKTQVGNHLCVKKLATRYQRFVNTYREAHILDLKILQRFLMLVHRRIDQFGQLSQLFGPKNLYVYGTFQAKTSFSRSFRTIFHGGIFKGFGIIDNYRKYGVNNIPDD